jgi:tetratricopeptide (TPR) repeat protein
MPTREDARAVIGLRATCTVLAVALAAGLVPPAAAAFAEPGTRLEPVQLAALAGGRAALLSGAARANVIVFFRTDQERSLEALRQVASCEKALAGKSVHWVALVSGSAPPAEARAAAAAAGIQMPVLVDEGDLLYEKLQIRLHPAIVIADGRGVLQAVEPYRQLDLADVLLARIRLALGEIDQAALERALDPEASHLPGDDPGNKAMRDVNMARRLVELGQYEAAVKQAQRALEQAPVPAAFGVLGLAYARLGRCPEAARALAQAQKVTPDSRDLAAARALCPAR